MDPADGVSMREIMRRDQVLQNFYNGKEEYHFELQRRRENGTIFYGSTDFRLCLNPESGDVICFIYTLKFDRTEDGRSSAPQGDSDGI